MKISACLFDMDGTLLDSEKFWLRVPILFLREHGLTAPEPLWPILGRLRYRVQLQQFYDIGLHPKGMTYDEAVEWCRLRMDAFYYEGMPVKPGVRLWLEAIRAQHVPCAILTATNEKAALKTLELTGLRKYFDYVASTFGAPFGKENPLYFVNAAAHFGARPEECLVIEDSLYAIKSAYQANCRVFAIREDAQTPQATQTIRARCGEQYFDTIHDAMRAYDALTAQG